MPCVARLAKSHIGNFKPDQSWQFGREIDVGKE
jgi:hypothetical protein